MAAGVGWAPPQLEGFILTERLGSGTYATVFKAYRKTNVREVVAIKCVNKKSLNKASVENLLTEIEILKNVRHPHIVELKDFQWSKEYIYLIMEFCAGGDLSRFIHSRRILPERVAHIFLQQLACALKFLHDQNISHLDLKPQNILLSSLDKPHLKLADFGFAQHMSPRDEKHVLRGSPLYMAPEMVCNRQYDARVDLWSVGVILYEALFGRPPFASKSFTELEEKIRSNQPIELPSRPRLSPECRDLLQRLLKRDPQQRISFQEFFAHPFVDLEHMPSEKSLGKATSIVMEAVKKDQEGEALAALSLYSKALEYFVPALRYETDARRKEAIRCKVSQYISRAEQLKAMVACNNKVLLQQGCPARDILKEMSKDKPRLYAALEVASVAVAKEEEGKDDGETLDLYQQSLGELLLMLAAEPAGRRRELLHAEIQTLMGRAEYLKEQIKMKESQWEAETISKEGMSDSVRSWRKKVLLKKLSTSGTHNQMDEDTLDTESLSCAMFRDSTEGCFKPLHKTGILNVWAGCGPWHHFMCLHHTRKCHVVEEGQNKLVWKEVKSCFHPCSLEDGGARKDIFQGKKEKGKQRP